MSSPSSSSLAATDNMILVDSASFFERVIWRIRMMIGHGDDDDDDDDDDDAVVAEDAE